MEMTLNKPSDVTDLFQLAIKGNANIETLERLMLMRREYRAEQAKEAFDTAMAGFQADCPQIPKKREVWDLDKATKKRIKVRYHYASMDDIIEFVKEPIAKNNLSYSFTCTNDNVTMTVACTVKHIFGHCHVSEFSIPIDKDAYMMPHQKVASAMTYAKRYAFINAFGIATCDDDDDGITAGDELPKADTKPPEPENPKPQTSPATQKQSIPEDSSLRCFAGTLAGAAIGNGKGAFQFGIVAPDGTAAKIVTTDKKVAEEIDQILKEQISTEPVGVKADCKFENGRWMLRPGGFSGIPF